MSLVCQTVEWAEVAAAWILEVVMVNILERSGMRSIKDQDKLRGDEM